MRWATARTCWSTCRCRKKSIASALGDITYIPLLASGFLYLALLMDLYSRRIVGWDFQDHMQESLVLHALRSAIANRQPAPGLIHPTDRGGQYAGTEYRQVLGRAGMQQSMSRADDCYDNAVMESCFGTIKTELEMEPYPNRSIAHKEISRYIRFLPYPEKTFGARLPEPGSL